MIGIHILLVEDNEGDILLTTETLQDSKIINKVSTVRNGKEALDFVFKIGKFSKSTTPDLILLDINLPLKSGHEVLEIVKKDTRTSHIPVIMLTTSSSQRDIQLSFKNNANSFITKPVEMNEFLGSILKIEEFWLNIVHLPKA
jgi:CheY-like chemotaxis protein